RCAHQLRPPPAGQVDSCAPAVTVHDCKQSALRYHEGSRHGTVGSSDVASCASSIGGSQPPISTALYVVVRVTSDRGSGVGEPGTGDHPPSPHPPWTVSTRIDHSRTRQTATASPAEPGASHSRYH